MSAVPLLYRHFSSNEVCRTGPPFPTQCVRRHRRPRQKPLCIDCRCHRGPLLHNTANKSRHESRTPHCLPEGCDSPKSGIGNCSLKQGINTFISYTGSHITLFSWFCWHQFKSCVLVQRSAKFLFPGCVYFCLAVPGWFLANFLADLAISVHTQ